MNKVKNIQFPSGSAIQCFLHSGNYKFPDYLFFKLNEGCKK